MPCSNSQSEHVRKSNCSRFGLSAPKPNLAEASRPYRNNAVQYGGGNSSLWLVLILQFAVAERWPESVGLCLLGRYATAPSQRILNPTEGN